MSNPVGIHIDIKEKDCAECGQPFTPFHANVQKWCKECRAKGAWFLKRFSLTKRLGSLAGGAKNRAKTKQLPCDIDTEYVLQLWQDQEGSCSVSGRVFDLESYGEKRQVNPNAPSIDRIVPALGYVKGNVRLVTYLTNVCLNEYGHDYLLDLCEDLIKQSGR